MESASGARFSAYDISADARPRSSVADFADGTELDRRASTRFPCSNDIAPNPTGLDTGMTMWLRLTRTALPSNAMLSIGANPPGVLRNCHGGFTWNGLIARYSVAR